MPQCFPLPSGPATRRYYDTAKAQFKDSCITILVPSSSEHHTLEQMFSLSAGATEKVHQFLSQQTDAGSAREQVLDLLESKKVIYGFGHRIYK